jgi:hypothetical protein
VTDEQPGRIDWRRPAGPPEAATPVRHRHRLPAEGSVDGSSSFEVGRVLRRASEIVRARWLGLFLVTFVLGWAMPHLIWLVAHSNYRSWSHDLTPLGWSTAVRFGMSMTYEFATATVMAIALRVPGTPALSSISQVLRALPALVPAWLVSHFDAAWDVWVSWSGLLRVGSRPIDEIVDAQLTAFGFEIALVLTATVAIGVFYPVVIEEGQNLLGGVPRTWRLMHGSRWRFAALFLIYMAAGFVISLPNTWVLAVRAGATVAEPVKWITGGLSDMAHAFWCVVVVASYIELRSVRDGPPHVQAAEAFA